MNIKNTYLFSKQTGSSRIAHLKQDTLNKEKTSYPNGYLVKNKTEQNALMTALSRPRRSGYIVQGERVTFPDAPKYITLTVISTSQIRVAFTSPNIKHTSYTVTSNLGDTSTGASSPIIVSGLTANTIYTFTVTATNITGSATSRSSTAVTTRTIAPTIGTATVSAVTEPIGNDGTIISYTVTSSPGGLTGTGTSSPISVYGLSPNTIYTFTVTATNSGGTSVASGASTAVTTRPLAPTIGTAIVSGESVVSVGFSAPVEGDGTITSYTVTSSPGGLTGIGTSSPISVYGLTSNTAYTFTTTATNSGGTSVASNASTSVTTL